ncbi:MAG: tRNA-queuosine alpha-mannosyltransferase domain-containing protein [Saprospiraceae bacterium]
MHIALIEPYYQGSHKYWANTLIRYSKHHFDLYSMPGRHWKWRMQGSAYTMAQQMNQKSAVYDLILASDFIDIALFKSLLNCSCPVILYMHENQLVYPVSELDKEKHLDLSYGYLNYKSCLAADYVVFNSYYHRTVFLEACEALLMKMPDAKHSDSIDFIKSKSAVLYPGIEFMGKYYVKQNANPSPIILWNHRWDYDKMPGYFVKLLDYLVSHNKAFEIIITTEPVNSDSMAYTQIMNRHKDKVIHHGHLESKADYWELISRADLLPVSPGHDFFGISVLEAVAAGVIPILPKGKVYHEHFGTEACLYYDSLEEYMELSKKVLEGNSNFDHTSLSESALSYDIRSLIKEYDRYFEKRNKA